MKPGRSLALLLLAAGCDCEGGMVTPSPAKLEVEPEILDLGEVFVGVLGRGVVTLRNTGTSSLQILGISLLEERFAIESRPEGPRLAPASSDVVVLTYRPTQVGVHQDRLLIKSDDPDRPEITVIVRLLAVEPPPCDDGNVCTRDYFDTDTERCEFEFTDGVSCEPKDRCIIDAVCQTGVCLGQRKTCNDDNACTRDLCRQIDGECLFVEAVDPCDDDNPCTVDLCDASGCRHEPVANGSPCDDLDLCTSGDACFAGLCVGTGEPDGSACDDRDSCTVDDRCTAGVCGGTSIVEAASEGQVIFDYPLVDWPFGAFLHRREVSLRNDGVALGMDHLRLVDENGNTAGLTHVIFTVAQCGSSAWEFAYRPADAMVNVRYVRREMQLADDGSLRIVVGVRQLPQDGFEPQSTTYVLDPDGRVVESQQRTSGGETGRSLLPDGSHVFGVVNAITPGIPTAETPFLSSLGVVRETNTKQILWRHDRTLSTPYFWAEFLGVAGPRVLFWANANFGALDFNTGSQVWSRPSAFVASEMALSTQLNLGLARVGQRLRNSQVLAVEIIQGNQVFVFPPNEDEEITIRTDPVISADGRIYFMVQRNDSLLNGGRPRSLEWVELTPEGQIAAITPLSDYVFPADPTQVLHEDAGDDPYPTLADDGVAYVGYGDHFWAIDPDGGIRWTLTSTVPNAYSGTVPLLRDDGVLIISEGSRKLIGIRTNGGRMVDEGWSSFRHDNRRTNFTP